MNIWLTILGMGLVTFGTRWLPLTVIREEMMPQWARRGLVYIPIAVLSAIIGPAFVPATDWGEYTLDGHLVAGIVAIGVAWYSKNTFLTILSGIFIFFILK